MSGSRTRLLRVLLLLHGLLPAAAVSGVVSRLESERQPAAGLNTGQRDAIPASRDTIPAPGAFVARTHVAADGSRLSYRLYLPQAYGAGGALPLVVMLHGCTQDAADIAAGTRLNTAAEANGFAVAYPEQDAEAHPFRCWRWFDPAHQARGAGEPELIAGMVRELAGELDVDPERIYVAGISAGAAMTVVLAAAYPDLFAAAAAHSGLVYAAAATEEAARHLLGGRVEDLLSHARMAHRAMGERARPVPLLIFHGTADPIVNPWHGADLARQWSMTNRLAAGHEPRAPEPGVERGEAGGYPYARYRYADVDTGTLVEHWVVEGLGHAWSGGSAAGTFTDSGGPDATAEMLRFFLTSTEPNPTR